VGTDIESIMQRCLKTKVRTYIGVCQRIPKTSVWVRCACDRHRSVDLSALSAYFQRDVVL